MKKVKRHFYIAIGLTLVSLAFFFLFPNFFALLESRWSDYYFKWSPAKKPVSNIVLATIDEQSLSELGRWPWPRSVMAKVLNKMSENEVKAVGFDITFSEPSSEDDLLVASLNQLSNPVLGYFFYQSDEEFSEAHLRKEEIISNEKSILSSQLSFSSKQILESGRKVFGVQSNDLEIIERLPEARQGFFNVFSDGDGVIRWLPLVLYYQNIPYPSLALQLASSATGFSPIPLYSEEGTLNGIALGDIKIPVSPSGELRINYRRPAKTFSHISLADILQKEEVSAQLKDKIVLIGATAVGIYDMRITPLETNTPGMEIQANVVDSILAQDFLKTDSTTEWNSILLVVGIGILFGWVLPYFSSINSFVFFLVVNSLQLLCGYFLFVQMDLLLPVVKPTLNGMFIFGGITLYRYFTEERERKKIRNAFQHYLSPSLVQELSEHPEKLKLGGERKILTVLFSDIRGFTSKSEKMPPEKVVELLDDYFTVMTDIVLKHGGTLDKYMGDSIMAIFGAPVPLEDHALQATQTALDMVDALKTHAPLWIKKYGLENFDIGIGIHTGPMAVGNMGSQKRFNYTVIGDAVNLTSRIEQLNKEYNTQILISDSHYQLVKDHINARELGPIRVRGKQETVVLYEMLGKK